MRSLFFPIFNIFVDFTLISDSPGAEVLLPGKSSWVYKKEFFYSVSADSTILLLQASGAETPIVKPPSALGFVGTSVVPPERKVKFTSRIVFGVKFSLIKPDQ